MGFFRSWEDALKRDSESKYRKMRMGAIVGELRSVQEISKDPERIGSIINSILNADISDDRLSEVERLVLQLGELVRSGKDFDYVLDELESLLKG